MKQKCESIQEMMSEDLHSTNDATQQRKIIEHINQCEDCKDIYVQWQFIRQEIRLFAEENVMETNNPSTSKEQNTMASRVMEQIYRQDQWRRPIIQNESRFTIRKFQRYSVGVAFFMSVFLIGFLYALISPPTVPIEEPLIGMQPIAEANGYSDDEYLSTTAMANITMPMKLTPDVLPSEINYLMIFSLVGLVSVVLIMNWFSRSKIN